jgi:hypothetical protein
MVSGSRKKILIFTIPNDGHLNILKRVIRDNHTAHAFGLVLVDQKNTPPDLSDVRAPVFAPRRNRAFVNTPASHVFERVAAVLDESLRIAREFDPDLILYDFCALEGHFVGRILGVPTWSSIPGLIGPLADHNYLSGSLASDANQAALATIYERYQIGLGHADIELISNSLHIPAERNLLWSYPTVTPSDFRTNRKPAEYQFAGYLSDGHPRFADRSDRPLVYLSFGTEVMDNLWPAQEATRTGVSRCVGGLAQRWGPRDLEVVFATQGQRVLDTYPASWQVHDKVDQQRTLSRSDVFVTHGGSNSFHEALLSRVPMVVTPFFGDQPLIGRRVEELGVGISLISDSDIDTGKPKHFLNDELTARIDESVRRILLDRRYAENLHGMDLEATPALAELT